METKSLISVIIPVYNVEKYLEQCMESVLRQTYSKLDIILVDDGSKDSSPEMCDDYAGRDNRVQVLHKENGGLMSAWMAGVNAAKGKYLVFVDSDDWIEPDMIEELMKVSVGSDKEIICSNYIIEKVEKQQSVKVKQSMKPGSYEREVIKKKLFPDLLGQEERRIHSSRCMKLISKELIVNNMKYANQQVTMGEDLNIMFAAMLDAERIVVLEEGFFYHYRLVNASMAHKYDPRMHEKIYILVETLQQIIEKKISNSKEKEMFARGLLKEYIFLLFIVIKNELRGPRENLTSRIQDIISDVKSEKGLKDVRVNVSGKANKLLYYIWKKPSVIRVKIGRLAIKIFDRM